MTSRSSYFGYRGAPSGHTRCRKASKPRKKHTATACGSTPARSRPTPPSKRNLLPYQSGAVRRSAQYAGLAGRHLPALDQGVPACVALPAFRHRGHAHHLCPARSDGTAQRPARTSVSAQCGPDVVLRNPGKVFLLHLHRTRGLPTRLGRQDLHRVHLPGTGAVPDPAVDGQAALSGIS